MTSYHFTHFNRSRSCSRTTRRQ